MDGDSRGTNNRILGAKPPIFPYISPGIPLHAQQPIKLLQSISSWINLPEQLGCQRPSARRRQAMQRPGTATALLHRPRKERFGQTMDAVHGKRSTRVLASTGVKFFPLRNERRSSKYCVRAMGPADPSKTLLAPE